MAKGNAFFVKPQAPAITPKRVLHHTLHRTEPHRGMERIHASELTREDGFCPRAYALYTAAKPKLRGEELNTSQQMTFRIGRDQQDAIVHWLADAGRVIGDWFCYGCETLHQWTERPDQCQCGCRFFKPEEVRFRHGATGASCGVDCLFFDGADLIPLELKTIDKEKFKDLSAPLAEHRARTGLYLDIIRGHPRPLAQTVSTEKGLVLYVSKGGWGVQDETVKGWGEGEYFSPLKEYWVKRGVKPSPYLTPAQVVSDYRAGQIGMPKGVCDHALAGRAKVCPMRKPCFSGKYPAAGD